tara:strand:+ start:22 stop:543 length:522 start_codon:yes stop_codon:yes gene_type:complete
MDSAALMYAGGLGFNQFGMVAAQDYFFENKKRKNSLPLLMNLIPADRKSNRQSIARLMVACREFLQPGNRAIIIYPEGTRSLDGEIREFKKGPAMIATELNIPIVPAYVHGTHDSLPKSGSFPKARRVTVRFGEAVDPERLAKRDSAKRLIYTEVTNELTKRIHALHDEHHGS